VEILGSLHCATRIPLSRIRFALSVMLWALGLAATAQESVSLGWIPSPSPQTCSYAVCYGTASGSYDYRFEAGTNTIATITNLVQGETYYFVVVTVDSDSNQSIPSNEVTYAVPDKPPAFNSIEFQNGQLVLNWNTVPGRNYQIEFKRNLTQSTWRPLGDVVTAIGPTTTFADNPGSNPGRFYRIRVLPDQVPVFEDSRE
jgi:hypothetical protein